jgi:hypothetical protein
MLRTSRPRPRNKIIELGDATPSNKTEPAPRLTVAKIGIVSRDYNEVSDFSAAFSAVMAVLEEKGCDTVLFSPWSIDTRKARRPSVRLRRIKSVLYETFAGNGKKRKGKEFVIFHRRGSIGMF